MKEPPPIDGATRLVALLGDPVAHSLSPAIMNTAFEAAALNWAYLAFAVPAAGFRAAVRGLAAAGAAGANVTAPHKRRAADCAGELSPEVRRTHSANTLVFRGGKIRAESTDGAGFLNFLRAAKVPVEGRLAVLAGSGGAARSLLYHLSRAGAETAVITRRPETARRSLRPLLPARASFVVAKRGGREAAALLERAALFVNATPLGAGAGDPLPADPTLLPEGAVVVDLLYAPRRTALIEAAALSGHRAMNGLGLLVHQASLSFEIWTGLEAPLDAMMRGMPIDDSGPAPGRGR